MLLLVFLTAWWFVLQTPLLGLLRGSFEFFGAGARVQDGGGGAWTFRIPMEVALAPAAQTSGATNVHAVIFDVPQADIATFTFSLPMLWAILLAIPGLRASVRPMLIGTLAMWLLETLLLFAFIEISAWKVAGQLSQSQGEFTKWWLKFGEYLVVMVIPYTAPVLLALWLRPDFRARIFGAEEKRTKTAR